MWKLAGILALSIFAGCGFKPTTQTQALNSVRHAQGFTRSMKANFQGHYLGACQEIYFNGLHLYALSDETFEEQSAEAELGNFKQWFHFYLDAACQIKYGEAKREGVYQLYSFQDIAQTPPVNRSGVAFTFRNGFFTPETRQVASLLTVSQFCGRRDWIAGEWSDMHLATDALLTEDMTIENNDASSFVRSVCLSITDHVHCVNVRMVRQ